MMNLELRGVVCIELEVAVYRENQEYKPRMSID